MLPCASTTTRRVLPAGVDAELAIRRRRASPDLHPLRRILARAAGPRRRRRVRVAPRQPGEGKLHVRTDLGKQPRLRTRDVRQLAAAEQIHAIRALGEDAARASICPLLVAGQRAEILRPPRDDFVRPRDILRADGVRHGGKRRAVRPPRMPRPTASADRPAECRPPDPPSTPPPSSLFCSCHSSAPGLYRDARSVRATERCPTAVPTL